MSRGARAALGVAALLWMSSCEAPGETGTGPNAAFGGNVHFEAAASPTWRRVFEDGVRIDFELTLNGFQGRDVPLRLFSAGGNLLGERVLAPRWESTYWQKIGVFVPYSLLPPEAGGKPIRAFVVSPGNASTYVGSSRFTLPEGWLSDVRWDGKRWVLDDTVDGQPGFTVVADLTLHRYVGKTLEAALVIQGEDGSNLGADVGGPIVVSRISLGAPKDEFWSYKELHFGVPYSRLARVPPSQLLRATPALRVGGGAWQTGNMHMLFWAGGSLERQNDRVRKEIGRIESDIDDVQRRLNALEPGSTP